jgi:MFS family permease
MPPIESTSYSLSDGLNRAWASTLMFVPNLIAFLLVLIIGYFIAMWLGKLVGQILSKLGFDKAVERSGIRKALESTGYHPSQILGKVVFYTIFLFVLQLAFGVFGPNPISELLTRVIAFLPNLFVAIVIIVLSASIAAAVRDIVKATLGGLSYGQMLAKVAAGAIILVGVFAALNQLNIAPEIVNGLFYAIMAIIVGVTVVALGGAGIVPLRTRWETALNAIEREVPRARQQINNEPPSTTIYPAPGG